MRWRCSRARASPSAARASREVLGALARVRLVLVQESAKRSRPSLSITPRGQSRVRTHRPGVRLVAAVALVAQQPMEERDLAVVHVHECIEYVSGSSHTYPWYPWWPCQDLLAHGESTRGKVRRGRSVRSTWSWTRTDKACATRPPRSHSACAHATTSRSRCTPSRGDEESYDLLRGSAHVQVLLLDRPVLAPELLLAHAPLFTRTPSRTSQELHHLTGLHFSARSCAWPILTWLVGWPKMASPVLKQVFLNFPFPHFQGLHYYY